ncbi:pentapeptide repeat-containing protein [Amycolatopsis sp. NPDC004625]|uniref:pentapeptide repeat-containing protein n=1 Tax=Amycolatopsis sp. NPDC004625 TaxID=3154670 RepID=UPI0033A3AD5B
MTDDNSQPLRSSAVSAAQQPSAVAPRARLRELSPTAMWLTAAVIAVLTAAVVVVLWWAATSGLNGAELVTARLDALKIGLSIGVGSGGVIALYLSWRRQHSTERALAHQEHDSAERRLTELYLKAVEQLGSPQAAVRHGGLYALERVAQDNPRQQQTVVNVICAYLRNPYTPPPEIGGPRLLGVRRPLLKSTERPRSPAATLNGGTRETQLQEREVRLTAQRILHQHLQPGTDLDHPRHDFWPDIDIDLTGATLIDFFFIRCRTANASFRSATFIGEAVFIGVQFGALADFGRSEFGGNVRFIEAEFGGDAWFGGAEFGDYAWFDEAKFGGHAGFFEAEFGGDAGFDGVEFAGNARFDGAEFGGNVRFDGAEFGGDAGFDEAAFRGYARFEGVKFGGDARFRGAGFGGDDQFDQPEFGGAEFGGYAWLPGAAFGGAEFGGDALFQGAKFGGNARFDEAKFGGNARFEGAVYGGRALDPAEHGVSRRADEPAAAGDPGPGWQSFC